MNERIIELADQAGFVYNFDPVTWLKYEKFAELIVKDCALVAGLMEYEGRKNIGAAILDKFGVKE